MIQSFSMIIIICGSCSISPFGILHIFSRSDVNLSTVIASFHDEQNTQSGSTFSSKADFAKIQEKHKSFWRHQPKKKKRNHGVETRLSNSIWLFVDVLNGHTNRGSKTCVHTHRQSPSWRRVVVAVNKERCIYQKSIHAVRTRLEPCKWITSNPHDRALLPCAATWLCDV